MWLLEKITERGERHGVALSMFIEAAPLKTEDLWVKLQAALDLISEHMPVWIDRMRRAGNSIHVRRIPGTRAMLRDNRYTILDPYLLADFVPAQIAASIVHEAMHAWLRARELNWERISRAREERACRAAEVRFGRRLLAAGVKGAELVLERAEPMLNAPDDEVAVEVDWEAWKANGMVTRINDIPVPLWLKRLIARRRGVLHTPAGRAAFGE